jgi:diguanylate cyclase (GGDEF)-like protein
VLLNNANLKQFVILHKLVNSIGFIVAPSVLYVGYLFIKDWANMYHKEKIKINYILLLPLLINGIGTLASYNANGLFYITSNNIYERGHLFFILPSVSYIYFGYTLYFIYKYRKKFTYSERVIFSSFYIVPAIFLSIQLKYSNFLTTWNSEAIIIVVTYIFILSEQLRRDSFTGLENRLSFDYYAESIADKMINKLFMIYIDIDDFKIINDQYGHSEGDEAIKTFANLLVESFPLRGKKLIRIGGDEFLILLEEGRQDRVTSFIENLKDNVKDYNDSEKKPYKLKFSYGCVCYTHDYESIYQLLEHADQLMYQQKQSKNVIEEKLIRR